MPSLERIGVLALGLFVAYLLALGLANSRQTLRVVVTVIGVALGGVPVAFLAQAESKWAYPLGLLLGVALFSIFALRSALVTLNESSLPSRQITERRQRLRRELWLALLGGAIVAVVAIVLPVRVTETERGEIELRSIQGRQNVRFARPFKNVPHLVFRPKGFVEYRLEDESVDGFTFVPTAFSPDSVVEWEATGEHGP